MSLIYLDNSATSFPKAPGVPEAVSNAIMTAGSSGRASYEESLNGSRILFNCRQQIAKLFCVADSSRIIINSGATESLNTVIQGYLGTGMRVLTSSSEHNSVMRILHHLKNSKGINIDYFKCHDDGTVDLCHYRTLLKRSPDLVILFHASNVSGAISPIGEMINDAHRHGSLVCIDGAQSAGHETIDLTKMKVDFFCFSGHKGLLGPAGTGGFYIKEGLEVTPLNFGGTGSLSEEETQPVFLPDRYESGTTNIPGIAGLGESVSYILKQGVGNIKKKEKTLTGLLVDGLNDINGIKTVGPVSPEKRNSVVSFVHNNLDLSVIQEGLDDMEIASRMGFHCAPSAHKALGTFKTGGTIRLSPGYFNTAEEIKKTITVIRNIVNG